MNCSFCYQSALGDDRVFWILVPGYANKDKFLNRNDHENSIHISFSWLIDHNDHVIFI